MAAWCIPLPFLVESMCQLPFTVFRAAVSARSIACQLFESAIKRLFQACLHHRSGAHPHRSAPSRMRANKLPRSCSRESHGSLYKPPFTTKQRLLCGCSGSISSGRCCQFRFALLQDSKFYGLDPFVHSLKLQRWFRWRVAAHGQRGCAGVASASSGCPYWP